MRNTRHTKATCASVTPRKRKIRDDDDDETQVTPVQVDSGDDQSGIYRSGVALGSDRKRSRPDISVCDEHKACFISKELGTRSIIFGKPLSGNMLDVFTANSSTGVPYGLLLTRVVWYLSA